MKILHAVLSDGFYGSERYCIEVATAQARAGHRVRILVSNGRSDCAHAFRREIALATAAIATEKSFGAIDLVAMPRWLPAILHRPFARRVLAAFAPDIVHSHLNPAARRVGQVAQRMGIAHVATMHIRYEKREQSGLDGLICYTQWQKGEIGPEFRGETTVVAAWVAAAVHAALARTTAADVAALRAAWGADEGTVVLGSVGRLVPEKGMDVLAQAFRAAFPQGDEPVRLLAAGDARITLSGPAADVARYYRAFDAYVSASRYEPFGLTILEAMAAGCPLVVTRTRGPVEFLTEPSVLWAEPGDVTTLAEQLSAAFTRGRKRPSYDLSPYTLGRAMAQIDAFYSKVLKKRRISG